MHNFLNDSIETGAVRIACQMRLKTSVLGISPRKEARHTLIDLIFLKHIISGRNRVGHPRTERNVSRLAGQC